MRLRFILPSLLLLIAFSSCKTYEMESHKGAEIDKVGDITKYKVYVHTAKKNIFQVSNPVLSASGLSGDATHITDAKQAEEIRTASTSKDAGPHKHDLNVFTKADIPDSAASVNVKKSEITEYSIPVAHSKINWAKIGEGIADGLGIAFSVALIGAIVYWFTLN